ncbi:hypothetical protein PSAC2689_220070 [Paraburkholderia sacchari]
MRARGPRGTHKASKEAHIPTFQECRATKTACNAGSPTDRSGAMKNGASENREAVRTHSSISLPLLVDLRQSRPCRQGPR